MERKKLMLCILDGWGHGQDPSRSAIAQANTPYIDNLYKNCPNSELVTYGEEVGLPSGQMGNSEVGHLNIGAGRVVYQELARINKAVENGSIDDNEEFKALIDYSLSNDKAVHILGLLSDGGVHSHIDHIIALANKMSDKDVKVYLHMFLDGRDTAPEAGAGFLEQLLKRLNDKASLSTVIGRYYAMDRDNRWDRIKKAYDLMVNGKGILTTDAVQTVKGFYRDGLTDEFMEAIKLNTSDFACINPSDAVLFANFRTDRPRQITKVLTQEDMPEYDMSALPLYFVTMTKYDDSFQNLKVIFKKAKLENTLGEVISQNELSQLRIAETEKYPHVTFFFSGGREEPFHGEHRILVNSPKVATYDLQPEMSAPELTERLIEYMTKEEPDLIILNYANADMVGHTGVFSAAVRSAETLDKCLSKLIPVSKELDYTSLIIADHGNSDIMINEDGTPHTSHTTNPVPVILIDPEEKIQQIHAGKLGDIAPTILKIMGLDIPNDMSGSSLVEL